MGKLGDASDLRARKVVDMVRGDDAALELMAQLVSLLADRRRGKREVQHDA